MTPLEQRAAQVEASGEAEKHAYPPLPLARHLHRDTYTEHDVMGYDDDDMRAYIDADRKARQLAACNFCLAQAAEARALYEKSQELFARERGITKELAEALRKLLRYVDKETCQHDETHRGGHIWTICDGCGRQWADDRGGFVPFVEPVEFTDARAALSKVQS